MISVDILTVAKKVDNYIIDATDNAATNLKWTSTTQQEWTVPAGKRWFLLGGYVNMNASGTATVLVLDSSDQVMHHLAVSSATTGYVAFPSQASAATHGKYPFQIILDTGDYVEVTCGVAQGAGAFAACVVLEIDI